MSFVPSIRECLQRLEQFADTPKIAADLDALNADLWGECGGCSEINAARPRLEALFKLANDLAANLRLAGSPPPAPPKPAPKPAVSIKGRPVERLPIGDFRPARPLVTVAAPKGPPAPRPAPQPEIQPEGTWTLLQMLEALDRSEPWVYKQMLHHGFPRPIGRHGRMKLWSKQLVHAWAEKQLVGTREALTTLRQRIRDAVAA